MPSADAPTRLLAPIDGGVDQQALLAILTGLPDPVVVLDRTGQVLWGSDAAEVFFGRSLDSSVGMSGLELVHPDDLGLVALSMQSIQRKRRGTPIEVRLLGPLGWRLTEVVGAPLTGLVDGAVALTIRDLTERRSFEVANNDDAKFRSLVHNAATLMLLVSEDGIVRAASGALARIVGHDPEAVMGQPLTALLDPSDRAAAEQALVAAATGPTGVAAATTVEVGLRHRSDDLTIPFELTIVNLLHDPTVNGFVVSGHDLTSRKATEGRLLSTLSLLNATLDSTSDGIYVVDRSGKMTLANRRFLDLWQIPAEIMASGDVEAARQHALAQLTDPALFEQTAADLAAHPEASSQDLMRFNDGRVYERRSQPQYVDGEIVGRVWSLHDATEQTRLEEQLAHQALHDSLTGLANQSLFRDRVDHALTRVARSHGHLAVLFLDIDNFKTVNDSLGHSAGDLLLVEVAERLQGCLRASDTAARLGGDEFAVLLEDLGSDGDAVVLAERVIKAFQRTFTVDGTEVSATMSVGIACASATTSCDKLLRNADLAMYTAKRAGKGRFEIYEGTMHAAAVKRLYAEAELRRALDNHEFRPYYQPIVDLTTGQTISLEALARWQHPERGVLSAAEFIPLAEETGLVKDISELVLDAACADLRRWRDEGTVDPSLSMSVNLAARQLSSGDLSARVAAVLEAHGLEPGCLVLEITESAMMTDTAAAMTALSELRALGVKIALDDFGTGYSSLSYLQRFPVDILKIDKSFVDGLDSAPELSALPQAIIALASTLHLTSIAEGIEREPQRDHLFDLGCQLGQGYLFAAPVPAEAIPALLRRRLTPRALRGT